MDVTSGTQISTVPVQSELFIEDENGGVRYRTYMIPDATFGHCARTQENKEMKCQFVQFAFRASYFPSR